MKPSSSDDKEVLWDETAKGIANVLAKLPSTWYGPNEASIYYTSERQQLEKYVRPFQYGLAATVFLFVNFRVTGNPRFQQWRKTWSKTATTPTSTPAHPPKGYLESKREENVQQALSSMRILTDLLVSVSVGASGTLFMLEAHRGTMRQDFEQSPLVPGRSVMAQQMCGPMQASTNLGGTSEAPGLSTWAVSTEPTVDANLETFRKFLANCERRQTYEQQVRDRNPKLFHTDKQESDTEEGVIVPQPGLSGYRATR